ncbi:DNA polymerase III subunit delta [bacterium]|nr:MAG: DNA polymerase III subunit delta [bacterium]
MILFLGGDNSFTIAQHIKKLRQQYANKYKDALDEAVVDMAVDGFAELEQSLLALPMFFSHRLVIIAGIFSLKDQVEQLESLLARVPDTTVAVIDGRGLDKRTRLYKVLASLPKAKIFSSLNPQDRINWIRTEAKRQGATILPAEAQYLIQRVGSDEWLLANELSKLALATNTITREVINEHTPKNVHDSVFDLIEAMGRGQIARAIAVYEELNASGANDQQIVATLMWHYRVLTMALERAGDDELRACGIKPYSLQKAGALIQDMSIDDIATAYELILDADIAMKTGEKKAHQAMVDLVMQLSEK